MHGGIYRCTGIYFFKSAGLGIPRHSARRMTPAMERRFVPLSLPVHSKTTGNSTHYLKRPQVKPL